MVFDYIENLSRYTSISKNIEKFSNYIAQHDITSYEPGDYTIDEDVYFTIKCYQPRTPEKAGWESHKVYMDIQYVMEGRELMGIMPAEKMSVKTPYNSESDKIVYENVDDVTFLKLKPGMFALLLPQDAHRPTIVDGEVTQNKKAVVKIRV